MTFVHNLLFAGLTGLLVLDSPASVVAEESKRGSKVDRAVRDSLRTGAATQTWNGDDIVWGTVAAGGKSGGSF